MNSSSEADLSLDEQPEAEVAEYRAISIWAFCGLLLSLFAFLGWLHPLLWGLAAIGALVNLIALAKISREGSTLLGRKAALIGLSLSIVAGLSAPAYLVASRYWLGNQADAVARSWFDYLQRGEPQAAFQLGLPASVRRPPGSEFERQLRENDSVQKEFDYFLTEPLPNTLIALGKKGLVRLYETEGYVTEQQRELVAHVYAVTHEVDGHKKSFFVRMTLERSLDTHGQPHWRVLRAVGGIVPASMSE